jgi:hypothetical protein
MNKDKEVILGYLKWLANRLSPSMATQLNGADVDEYLEQQVNSVDLADVGGNEVALIEPLRNFIRTNHLTHKWDAYLKKWQENQ